MQNEIENKPGLPLPKWAMVIIALPTFYMPLAYSFMAVWVIGSMLFGYSSDVPDWMKVILEASLYVTCAMWPFYLLWAVVCKRLNWKEKALWMLIIIFLNMVGMPMFYVFITRRYLGKEGQTNTKDENAAQKLLAKCNASRAELSPEQWRVWVSYCRKVRFSRLGLIPLFLMAALMLYTAIWYVPNNCINMFSDFCPTKTVIIDSARNTEKEILPDIQATKLNIESVMMVGGMVGMMVAISIFAVAQSIGLAYLDLHRKAFIDFLKAKNKSI